MKRVDIEVEHYYKNKFLGRKKLKPGPGLSLIGQDVDCQFRLLGDGVGSIHAALEYVDETWNLIDLGSESGTWVKKEPVISLSIEKETPIRIGSHMLKIIPHKVESHLFNRDLKTETKTGQRFHQIIVRKNSFVTETHLLSPEQDFNFNFGASTEVLKAPTTSKWKTTDFDGGVTVQQRIVPADKVEQTAQDKLKSHVDPSLKTPMAAALVLMFLFTLLFAFAPDKPEEELAELTPDKKNRYARMIYDSKAVKKVRQNAKKVQKNIVKPKTNMAQSQPAKGPKVSGRSAPKTAKVLTKIKAAGLSQLIGKISKRAAKNANVIKARGVSPDSRSGRALASVGGIAGKTAQANSGSFKLKGVKTAGIGGGGSTKGIGGLSVGNIGNASVGILEEETEVQGGLDRSVIARVIESNLGQIRYCYERQLSANPELYGKVQVKFSIGAQGNVTTQNVGRTTLNSAMVEGCILRRVAGWRFPKPKGGTNVFVTYPFLFKSTN